MRRLRTLAAKPPPHVFAAPHAAGGADRAALPRFAAVAALGVALNALVLAAMLALVGPQYLVAQIVATGAVLAGGYLANRTWTF